MPGHNGVSIEWTIIWTNYVMHFKLRSSAEFLLILKIVPSKFIHN